MKYIADIEVLLPLNQHPEIIRAERWTASRKKHSVRMPNWSLHFPHYEMDFSIMGKTYHIYPGCMVLTPPDTETTSVYPGRQHHYFAHFQYSGIDQNQSELSAVSPVIDLEDEYIDLNNMFLEVIRNFNFNRIRGEVSLWHMLYRIFGFNEDNKSDSGQRLPSYIINALNYIQENLGSKIQVSAVAEYAGVSPEHLSRSFKNFLRTSPAKYILRKRMTEAKKQLETTDFMVKEIGQSVGISDPQHFNKLIKKQFGYSPSELRKKSQPLF